MNISRRQFIGATSVAIALVGSRSWAQQPPGVALRVRKNITSLNEQSPDVVALKTAAERMRQLPDSDYRSWRNQAKIHGDILGSFGSCRHSSWFFLPWHRAYLHCFEEIVRELSGNQDFALPYWDWSTDFKLPGLFWGNSNPLSNPARPGETGSGRKSGLTSSSEISPDDRNRFVGQGVIESILRISDFETFGGSMVADLDDMNGVQGRLEGGPHNFIHRWVGGDMGSGGSPMDPIFWMHHCNIDRLWAEWMRRNPQGTPNAANWLDATFRGPYKFYDRHGNALETLTVRRVLNTANLGYRYDLRSNTSVVQLTGRASILPLSVSSALLSLQSNRIAEFALKSNAELASRVSTIIDGSDPVAAQRTTIRMTISGIVPPRNQDTLLQVHVNCKLLSPNLPITDPSYVASATFFTHEGGHAGHGGHHALSFFFSLNQAFGRLYADRPFSEQEPLKVAVISQPLFSDEPGGAAATTIEELNPKQVKIELVAAAPVTA